jgi:hypothetical protein
MSALKSASLTLGLLFAMSAGAQGIVSSAQGSHQYHRLTTDDYLRTLEFTAVRDSQNNQRGQGQFHNHGTGTTMHFVIDCLNVTGNVATMSGRITRSNIESLDSEKPPIWMRVVDNGEGRKSPVDEASGLIVFHSPAFPTCNTAFSPPLVAIEGGNIQVK